MLVQEPLASYAVALREIVGAGEPLNPELIERVRKAWGIAIRDGYGQTEEGEIALSLTQRPLGLMRGYANNEKATAEAMRNGYYNTSDIALRHNDGYFVYVGRTDDVFKSSDYRLSPFELESILVEHEAIAEAAVVPSPCPCGIPLLP